MNTNTPTALLHRVDLCFVVDTTGSMGGFLGEAKKRLIDTLEALSNQSKIDLSVGLVEFRDHPPQDNSFITQVTNLTNNVKDIQSVIDKLKAEGGGDGPEAVYRGIADACNQLTWRDHSIRYIVLVGDSPPHGFPTWFEQYGPTPTAAAPAEEAVAAPRGRGRGRHPGHGMGIVDSWPRECPSGLNVQKVAALCEKNGITLHALAVGRSPGAHESFTAIALATGGTFRTMEHHTDAIQAITAVLSAEFANVVFDAEVLEAAGEFDAPDSGAISQKLDCPRLKVASSLARLGRRGFLN